MWPYEPNFRERRKIHHTAPVTKAKPKDSSTFLQIANAGEHAEEKGTFLYTIGGSKLAQLTEEQYRALKAKHRATI